MFGFAGVDGMDTLDSEEEARKVNLKYVDCEEYIPYKIRGTGVYIYNIYRHIIHKVYLPTIG